MRDVLIHNYISVDIDEVWNTTTKDLPELELAVRKYLQPSSL